jgi:hypothetical protein
MWQPRGTQTSLEYSSARTLALSDFQDAENASNVIKGMGGFVLDGHMLKVKFAGREQEMVVEKSAKLGRRRARNVRKRRWSPRTCGLKLSKKNNVSYSGTYPLSSKHRSVTGTDLWLPPMVKSIRLLEDSHSSS